MTTRAMRVKLKLYLKNAQKKRVRKRKAGREIPTATKEFMQGCEGMAEALRKMALEQTG